MRISYWSSDVCSSDLHSSQYIFAEIGVPRDFAQLPFHERAIDCYRLDRKSVVLGKSVSFRVDLGGRRFIKKKSQYLLHLIFILTLYKLLLLVKLYVLLLC